MFVGHRFIHLPGAHIEHLNLSGGYHRPLWIGHDAVQLRHVSLSESERNAQKQEQSGSPKPIHFPDPFRKQNLKTAFPGGCVAPYDMPMPASRTDPEDLGY